MSKYLPMKCLPVCGAMEEKLYCAHTWYFPKPQPGVSFIHTNCMELYYSILNITRVDKARFWRYLLLSSFAAANKTGLPFDANVDIGDRKSSIKALPKLVLAALQPPSKGWTIFRRNRDCLIFGGHPLPRGTSIDQYKCDNQKLRWLRMKGVKISFKNYLIVTLFS